MHFRSDLAENLQKIDPCIFGQTAFWYPDIVARRTVRATPRPQVQEHLDPRDHVRSLSDGSSHTLLEAHHQLLLQTGMGGQQPPKTANDIGRTSQWAQPRDIRFLGGGFDKAPVLPEPRGFQYVGHGRGGRSDLYNPVRRWRRELTL